MNSGIVTVCPKCGESDWRCWDKRYHWYKLNEPDYEGNTHTQILVSFLVCNVCQHEWIDAPKLSDADYIGDDRDAGFYD